MVNQEKLKKLHNYQLQQILWHRDVMEKSSVRFLVLSL